MKLAAVCVSREEIGDLGLPFPSVNVHDSTVAAPRGTVERVRLIAELRNRAMKHLLREHPETTHVLMIDSYYLNQFSAIRQLIDDYVSWMEHAIVGGCIWQRSRTRLRRPWTSTHYYDWGSTPEAKRLQLNTVRARCLASLYLGVHAVGGVYIFPVTAWQKNGYSPRLDSFEVEHVSLCKDFQCYLDLKAEFWRNPLIYSYGKMVRIALGDLRRRLGSV